MENLNNDYKLSIYTEVAELLEEKVYIVKSSLDNKIYIKKVLDTKNENIYKKIKDLSIANIPKIYEILKLGEELIVIEEYINGSSLIEILKEHKIMPQNKVISYTLELIEVVGKIHSCKPPIIHKDINPSNIMINNDGILKLIDFDISRNYCQNKNMDTHILGTHGYAAPEQFGFNQTDSRTDIYSLGVTMNVMLVGKLPNEKRGGCRLSKIISKCLEIDPNKRYQNIDELRFDLLKLNKKYDKNDTNKFPGFKSANIFFKIIASLWYFFLLIAALGFLNDESLTQSRILDIKMSLLLFSLTLLYGNYNGIKDKLPMIKSKNKIKKILGYIIYSFLLFMILL